MTEQEHRELDARVAVEVMGWRLDGYWWVDADGKPIVASITENGWYPSQEIAAAWQVVERLRAEGWIVRVQEMPDGLPLLAGAGWRGEEAREIHKRAVCMLYPSPAIQEKYRRWAHQMAATADTAPEAICKAALEWAERRAGE